MNKHLTLSIAATLALGLSISACGGSDSGGGSSSEPGGSDASAEAGEDELGGVGPWTGSQLCALSSVDEVSQQFDNSQIEERAGVDDPLYSTCRWGDLSDVYAPSQMSIEQTFNFTSDRLGADVDIDLVGADMAGFYNSVGGAALLTAVVGKQALNISFPVDTAGAEEFGTAIASIWVAAQQG